MYIEYTYFSDIWAMNLQYCSQQISLSDLSYIALAYDGCYCHIINVIQIQRNSHVHLQHQYVLPVNQGCLIYCIIQVSLGIKGLIIVSWESVLFWKGSGFFSIAVLSFEIQMISHDFHYYKKTSSVFKFFWCSVDVAKLRHVIM